MNATKRGLGVVVLSILICCLVTISGAVAGNIIIGPSNTYMGKIVIVSPLLGDTATSNGTALLNALAGITTASSTEPYLLKVGPGLYDLGTTSLQMKPYVDIEGSGETVTIIQGSCGSSSYGGSGVVRGANDAEIRFLTVKSTGGGSYASAFYNDNFFSPMMTNVTLIASDASNTNYGVYNNYYASPSMTNVNVNVSGLYHNYGVYNYHSSPMMNNVNVTISGSSGSEDVAIENDTSSPAMTNVTTNVGGGGNDCGVRNWNAGYVTITNSVIQATTHTIYNSGAGMTTRIANTQLDGGAVFNSGTLTCVGAYAGSFIGLGTNCQ